MLTSVQKTQFLEALSLGLGRYGATQGAGAIWPDVRETLRVDGSFRDSVRLVEGSLLDSCRKVIYDAAAGGSSKAASLYLTLDQSARLNALKLKLAARQVAVQEKAVDHLAAKTVPLDFRALSSEEFARYAEIHSRIRSGEPVTTDEAFAYCDLTAKISTQPQAPAGLAIPALNGQNGHGTPLEELFDEPI